jgi:hypothetical protein
MLTLFGCCSLLDGAPAWAQQPVGAARIVVNDVRGTLPAVREAVTLRIGADLVQNEVIDTAANSATLLVFQDDTQLAVCPSAEVVLSRAEFAASPTGPTLVVFIPRGCTQLSSGLLLKTAFLNTPSCQIRTYGTIVTVTVSSSGATTVSVAEGTAGVTGAGVLVNVGTGQSTLVQKGRPPTPPVPTPPAPPIVSQMKRLLVSATQDYGTRAAARSPAVEAPTDAGTNMFTPNVDGKIQSQIAGDACPAFGINGTFGGAPGSNGTHGGAPGSNGTHGGAPGSNGTHGGAPGSNGTHGGAPGSNGTHGGAPGSNGTHGGAPGSNGTPGAAPGCM